MPHILLSGLTLTSCAISALAQTAPKPLPDPLDLVARAEQLCTDSQQEDAILLLWDALEQLSSSARPARASGMATALYLLQANDPLHGDRLAAYTAFARAQVDLAMLYRGKKWFVAAAERLDFADRFDRTASIKERAQLAAARPKGAEPTAPSSSFLVRKATARVDGPWSERGDVLECGAHPTNSPWYEWVLDSQHEDCELSIEFCSSDPKAGHDCALLVGVDGRAVYQAVAAYYADQSRYDLTLFEHNGDKGKTLTYAWVGCEATPDGFHRLTFRVHGNALRAQLDSAPPIEAKVSIAPRGRFGITVGLYNQGSAAISMRNLRWNPWPPLTDEQLQAAARKRVAAAIDQAPWLIDRKDPETASMRLREALQDAGTLPAGALRDGLTGSIDKLLGKADLLHARRKKVSQDGARTLVALANRYAEAGQVRAALRLAQVAAVVDPEGSAASLALAKAAVDAWQKQHNR